MPLLFWQHGEPKLGFCLFPASQLDFMLAHCEGKIPDSEWKGGICWGRFHCSGTQQKVPVAGPPQRVGGMMWWSWMKFWDQEQFTNVSSCDIVKLCHIASLLYSGKIVYVVEWECVKSIYCHPLEWNKELQFLINLTGKLLCMELKYVGGLPTNLFQIWACFWRSGSTQWLSKHCWLIILFVWRP